MKWIAKLFIEFEIKKNIKYFILTKLGYKEVMKKKTYIITRFLFKEINKNVKKSENVSKIYF